MTRMFDATQHFLLNEDRRKFNRKRKNKLPVFNAYSILANVYGLLKSWREQKLFGMNRIECAQKIVRAAHKHIAYQVNTVVANNHSLSICSSCNPSKCAFGCIFHSIEQNTDCSGIGLKVFKSYDYYLKKTFFPIEIGGFLNCGWIFSIYRLRFFLLVQNVNRRLAVIALLFLSFQQEYLIRAVFEI